MKIMVTGGAGFIGSNVVDTYIKAGHQVVVVDNLFTGKKGNLNPAAKFYEVDIRSDEIDKIFKHEKVEILNHHAAQMSVPASVEDPLFDADVNVKGFLNLLEKAVKHHVKKCIFISSGGAIYGEATQYPTTEEYPPIPLSPYAITKFVSEYYLGYYKHQYGLENTILRYANVYGPRQIPHGEAGVVAIFMSHLLKEKPSMLFHFPEDIDGMIRDYCFVEDIARANLIALTTGDGGFFNIGTGVETKTKEVYDTIYEVIKEKRPELPDELFSLERKTARPGDLKKSCLVISKAKKGLGWAPTISLKEGLRKVFIPPPRFRETRATGTAD